MACDDEIPSLMLISLIAKGFQPDISEKVLDKDPQTFEDLFKFAKRAESTVKIRKNDSLIASIEGMEDRLMTKLSKQLETTVMALDRRDQYAPAEVHDRYTSSNQQNNSHTNVHTRNHGRPRGHDFRSRDILKVKAETDRNSPTMPLNTDLATKETASLGPLLRPDSMVTIQPRINVNLVPVSAQIVLWTIVIRLIVLLLANIVFIVMGSIIFKLHVFLTLLVHYIES